MSKTHIYYDMNLINNHPDKIPMIVAFNENRDSSFITNPSEYYLSVIRFELNTSRLPVMIPRIVVIDGNVYFDMSITIAYDTIAPVNYSAFRQIPFLSSNQSLTPLNNRLPNSTDFWVYSYEFFCNCVNWAINDATEEIMGYINDPVINATISPAQLRYDPPSQLFSFVGQLGWFGATNGFMTDATFIGSEMNIYINDQLRTALETIPVEQVYGPDPIAQGKNLWHVMFYNKNNLELRTVSKPWITPSSSTTDTMIISQQESSSIAYLNPIGRIVFTSLHLPVTPNLIAEPKPYASTGTSFSISTNNYSNIITDFVVPFAPFNTYINSINYSPEIYRLLDMFSNSPLHIVDINVYWADKFGNLYPIKIEYGASASVKLVFIKKDFKN